MLKAGRQVQLYGYSCGNVDGLETDLRTSLRIHLLKVLLSLASDLQERNRTRRTKWGIGTIVATRLTGETPSGCIDEVPD